MIRHVDAPTGATLACEVSGSGPPLVTVHGAGSARWGFDLVRPLLEPSFTVWAYDRRGRGDSTDPPGEYAIGDEVAETVAVAAAAGDGVCLLGHSFGGLIAAAAAPLLPGLQSLVLYEPPMGGVLAEAEFLDRLERLLDGGARDAMVAEFLSHVGGYTDAEIDAMRLTPVWAARMATAPTVLRELRAEHDYRLPTAALAGLTVPVLMLVGTESPGWAVRSTEAYAAAIPGVRVMRLEGQGHGATAGAPDLVAAEVKAFAG